MYVKHGLSSTNLLSINYSILLKKKKSVVQYIFLYNITLKYWMQIFIFPSNLVFKSPKEINVFLRLLKNVNLNDFFKVVWSKTLINFTCRKYKHSNLRSLTSNKMDHQQFLQHYPALQLLVQFFWPIQSSLESTESCIHPYYWLFKRTRVSLCPNLISCLTGSYINA